MKVILILTTCLAAAALVSVADAKGINCGIKCFRSFLLSIVVTVVAQW